MKIRSRMICVLLIALALCLATGTALAKTTCTLAVSVSGNEQRLLSRVSEGKYSVYLPGTWDASAVQVEIEGADSVCIGDLVIQSGGTPDLSGVLGKKLPFTTGEGKKLGTITVYQGSPIAGMYVQVDPAQLKLAEKDKHTEITEGTVTYQEPDGTVTYSGPLASFKGRGNNTFAYRKKPFQIKLEKKADLSGMGKSKTWLLLANYNDVTMLRNQVALELTRAVGQRFSIECRPVDLYINGAYNGLYLLTEKVQIGSSRVDITNLEEATEKLNDRDPALYETFREKQNKAVVLRASRVPVDPEDITGGYIIEMEKPYRFRQSSDSGFQTSMGLCFNIKEPTYPSAQQAHYISALVQDVHDALWARDGVSPTTGRYYADLIDLHSFALKYLVEDLTKNYDYRSGSQFFYKDSDAVDGRIYAGPGWDYDLTFGTLHPNASGEYVAATGSKSNLWWLLARHEDFKAELRSCYWNQLRPACEVLLGESVLDEACPLLSLDAYRDAIAASARMNYGRWSEGASAKITGGARTFDAGVEQMRTFLRKRIAFFDKYFK